GSNGAGKSTLCKVVAQLIPPDEGELVVRGRVSPLLGLGAGFNRELSGRDNVYLSGTLMGLGFREIDELVSGILEFSELEDFIDNPVRTYSQGMRARLAFAIATVVEPDLLVLDEILGVGDPFFRERSRQRLRQMVEHSRAALIVSHSTEMLAQICNRGMWLDRGGIVEYGEAKEVFAKYREWHQRRLGRGQKTSPAPEPSPDGQRRAESEDAGARESGEARLPDTDRDGRLRR
ncbi:MAG: ABC transporter ATP-binding protein, partial [Candidatus Binatia bacterium]